MRRRVLAIPVVGDLDSFSRLVAHIAHYLGHVDLERVMVPVEPHLLAAAHRWLESPALPPAFGESVIGRVESLHDRITLVSWQGDPESLGISSDLVLDWDVAGTQLDPWASLKAGYRLHRSVFKIDWDSSRPGAAWLAEAARILQFGRNFDKSQAEQVKAFLEGLRPAAHAYLLGSGPSARAALDHDLSDGVRIVCDAAIFDAELMAHVRPDMVAAADPIFDVGPSTYSERFRRALAERSADHDFVVVTTERYAPLLRAHVPGMDGKIIGLRQGTSAWPVNLDLMTGPAVHPFPDVLTHLMLPLAASVSPSICLIGFDGRASDEDDVWQHRSTVPLDDELRDIRLVHPASFGPDFVDGYDDHLATLERLLVQIEERGGEVRSLTRSDIPALRRRSASPTPVRVEEPSRLTPALVSLTPDWIGDFGHFGPFERRVHAAAAAAGHTHLAVASAGLEPLADWQIPLFSEATLPSGRFAPVGEHFEAELRTGLASLQLASGSAVFLYTADVWHVAALLSVAADSPHVRFVANLMRSHGWIEEALGSPDPWVESLVDLLRTCLDVSSGTNVEVTVDSEALARDVESLTGQPVSVWPMISVSDPSPFVEDRSRSDSATHIVAPVQAHSARGFHDVIALAARVQDRVARGELRLTARWPFGANRQVTRMAELFESRGGRLVRDYLTDDEYRELVQSADVVLVPYSIRPFRTRTSAVAVDALMAAKPVVAVRGTWAGDLVERHAAGVTYAEGDVEGLAKALSDVVDGLDAYRVRAFEARTVVAREHAPDRLIEFLLEPPTMAGHGAVATQLIAVQREADRMRRSYRHRLRSEGSSALREAIRGDDQMRDRETLRDEVELLSRGITYWQRAAARSEARRQAMSSKEVAPVVARRPAWRQIGVTLITIGIVGGLLLGLVTIGLVALEVLWLFALALAAAGLSLLTISARRRSRT